MRVHSSGHPRVNRGEIEQRGQKWTNEIAGGAEHLSNSTQGPIPGFPGETCKELAEGRDFCLTKPQS